MTHVAQEPTDAQATEMVRHKAERMARARRERRNFWRTLSHVGVLGWLFVLPLVVGVAVGRYLADTTGYGIYVLVGLVVGLLVGGYVAWKAVQAALAEVRDQGDMQEKPRSADGKR